MEETQFSCRTKADLFYLEEASKQLKELKACKSEQAEDLLEVMELDRHFLKEISVFARVTHLQLKLGNSN